MSDIDGVNSFWIQARAEWESEKARLEKELSEYKLLRAHDLQTIGQLREENHVIRHGNVLNAELEATHAQLIASQQNLRRLKEQAQEWEEAWKKQADDSARLKAAITQMITYLSGDNFRSQQMAHAKSVGEKALKGRYGL